MKSNVSKLTLTALLTLPMLAGCSSQTLKTVDKLDVEYGTPISTEVAQYLSEDIDKEDKAKILAEAKVEILEDKKVEGKDYQQIGEYTVKVTYDDEVSEVKVTVSDTVKPVFKDLKKEVSYVKDCKPSIEDFSKQFKAEDLDKVTITVDDSQVDYTKEGSYKATVTATDESGNAETKEVTVNIKKPEIKLDKTSKSVYVKESFVLKSTVKGKDTKAAFKSSNSAVATVSETGKVTAKKKGTATITATANGVEAKCKVTVKALPSGSSTTTQTVTNPTTGKKEEVVVVKPSKPKTASATTSREAFNLINKERQKAGLPALKWSNSLASKAKIRVKQNVELVSQGKRISHIYKGEMPEKIGIYSEILADTSSSSPSYVVNGWMNSSAHKKNILDTRHIKGATVMAKYNGRHIWVTVFE